MSPRMRLDLLVNNFVTAINEKKIKYFEVTLREIIFIFKMCLKFLSIENFEN